MCIYRRSAKASKSAVRRYYVDSFLHCLFTYLRVAYNYAPTSTSSRLCLVVLDGDAASSFYTPNLPLVDPCDTGAKEPAAFPLSTEENIAEIMDLIIGDPASGAELSLRVCCAKLSVFNIAFYTFHLF